MKENCASADFSINQKTYDKIVAGIKKLVNETSDGYTPDDAVAMFCAKYLSEYSWKKNGEEGCVSYVKGAVGMPEFAVLCEPKGYFAFREKGIFLPLGFKLQIDRE